MVNSHHKAVKHCKATAFLEKARDNKEIGLAQARSVQPEWSLVVADVWGPGV